MMRSDGTLPAAQFLAALQAGNTAAEAHNLAYPTPELHSPKRSSADGQHS